MHLIDIINKSDIALIEGASKLGKLTFALYAYSQNEKIEKVTILSSIQKKLMQKRIHSIQNLNDENINKLLKNIEFLCLKENWLEIKSSYGFDFIYEDIERIVQNTKCDAIILHRPDLMFSNSEYDLARLFLEKFIEIANNYGKKTFITSDMNHFITEFLENYTDISMQMKKKDNIRKIIIKHSLYPVTSNLYDFIFKNNKFELINEKENSNIDIVTSKNDMLVISQDERFKKIHSYIFSKYFNIEFASNLSEVIKKIENKPEIIIYQDQETIPEFDICNTVKNISPHSNIIFILNKDYIRAEDKMDAIQSKCYEVFSRNFNLEEYILTIEKINQNFFYSNKLKLLPPQKIATNYENFCKAIKSLYNERIFFSVVEYSEFKDEIISRLRTHDIIYKKDELIYLCLVNVTKEMFESNLKEKLELTDKYHFIEAIEWDGKC